MLSVRAFAGELAQQLGKSEAAGHNYADKMAALRIYEPRRGGNRGSFAMRADARHAALLLLAMGSEFSPLLAVQQARRIYGAQFERSDSITFRAGNIVEALGNAESFGELESPREFGTLLCGALEGLRPGCAPFPLVTIEKVGFGVLSGAIFADLLLRVELKPCGETGVPRHRTRYLHFVGDQVANVAAGYGRAEWLPGSAIYAAADLLGPRVVGGGGGDGDDVAPVDEVPADALRPDVLPLAARGPDCSEASA